MMKLIILEARNFLSKKGIKGILNSDVKKHIQV